MIFKSQTCFISDRATSRGDINKTKGYGCSVMPCVLYKILAAWERQARRGHLWYSLVHGYHRKTQLSSSGSLWKKNIFLHCISQVSTIELEHLNYFCLWKGTVLVSPSGSMFHPTDSLSLSLSLSLPPSPSLPLFFLGFHGLSFNINQKPLNGVMGSCPFIRAMLSFYRNWCRSNFNE